MFTHRFAWYWTTCDQILSKRRHPDCDGGGGLLADLRLSRQAVDCLTSLIGDRLLPMLSYQYYS